ncbi:MAG: hypothetical protein ACI8RZ_002761 [Myxococcota bacterium]|jgi:hypothetical protein
MRSTGVLLIASAFFELLSVTSPVPFLGAVRDGAAAFLYHGVFAVTFTLMGAGLWQGAPWGYRVVMAGMGIYTLDRVRYLLDHAAREAELQQQTQGLGQLFDLVDEQLFHQVVSGVTLGVLVSALGFALYVHVRRDYFQPPMG